MLTAIGRIFKEVLNWNFFKKAIQVLGGFAIVGLMAHIGRIILNTLGTDGCNIAVQAWRNGRHIWKNRN